MSSIPVTVLVVAKNEESRLAKCLAALSMFDEIVVADSGSTDDTQSVARSMGAHVVDYKWDGQYPKKRQWCLDNLTFSNDWVFMIDADEIVTPELCREIQALFETGQDKNAAGFFVKGIYVRGGKILHYGMKNNKIALLDRRKMEYPVINDLDIDGMGEIEGHYQPVLKPDHKNVYIGRLRNVLFHEAYGDDGGQDWARRHRNYARWEAAMDIRGAWPEDPSPARRMLKAVFKSLPFRPAVAFLHSYIFRAGCLDGQQGYLFARDRARYYRMIAAEKKKLSVSS